MHAMFFLMYWCSCIQWWFHNRLNETLQWVLILTNSSRHPISPKFPNFEHLTVKHTIHGVYAVVRCLRNRERHPDCLGGNPGGRAAYPHTHDSDLYLEKKKFYLTTSSPLPTLKFIQTVICKCGPPKSIDNMLLTNRHVKLLCTEVHINTHEASWSLKEKKGFL